VERLSFKQSLVELEDRVPEDTVVHEKSYSRLYLGGFVHRARLKTVKDTLRRHVTGAMSSWADFGCSNGFVIDSVLKNGGFSFDRIVGYDHSHELLEMAAGRQINNARFLHRDMNVSPPPRDPSDESYELVTCFETLEHVADYRLSFEHLYTSAKPEGLIIVAVPNETGLPGLVKLWGRRLARRNPNGDFFEGKSLAAYTKQLVTGGYIDGFRTPNTKGYGPHLGFDYRRLLEHIESTYVVPGCLALVEQTSTLLGMNVVLVYRRREQHPGKRP
jgi:2-polyprenyl-3-methyl-5-hydroxy-6-metoxy-1,4-benzoquinol methylase